MTQVTNTSFDMEHVFIRALWGNHTVGIHGRCLEECKTTIQKSLHPPGTLTYCYGTANRDFLLSVGDSPVMLDEDPMGCLKGQTPEGFSLTNSKLASKSVVDGEVRQGMRMWIHKFHCMLAALKEHQSVTWLDWDTFQVATLSKEYVESLHAGQPLRTVLRKVRNPHYWWRDNSSGTDLPHGGMIYCRDVRCIQQIITLQNVWTMAADEDLLGLWVELQLGPWTNDTHLRWKSEGWEIPGFRVGKQLFWPEEAYFVHHKTHVGLGIMA